MKTVSRQVTRINYILGNVDLTNGTVNVTQKITRPIDISDRAFKKELKNSYPNESLITTQEETIMYCCTLKEFIECCNSSVLPLGNNDGMEETESFDTETTLEEGEID